MGDTSAAIDAWVERNSERVVEFARRLVRIPSEIRPPYACEEEAQGHVAQVMGQLGFEVDMFDLAEIPELKDHPLYFPTWDGMPRPLENRPDVVGRVRGRGGGRSILFSSHVDTVAKEPVPWTTAEPFGGEIIEGKLYGRGAYDDKCGVATSVFAAACVKELGFDLRGDVVVESVTDEEGGGSHGTLAARLRGYQADVAINCEPTNMIVCPSHRGGGEWRITVRGTPGMAFDGKRLVDPVSKLADTILALNAFNEARNRCSKREPLDGTVGELPLYITQIGGGGDSYWEQMGVPASCYLYAWIEEYEGVTEGTHDQELIESVNAYLRTRPGFDGTLPEYRHTIRYLPGSSMSLDHPVFPVLEQAFASSGREYQVASAPFACDAYVFNLFTKTPALVLGPGGDHAHAPDEYVIVQDMLDLVRIYARTIVRWCQ
jgi:acetylornithine deacetylase